MNLRLIVAALAVAAAPIFAAEDENPYKKAKIGDFSTFKMTTSVGGFNVEGVVSQQVVAKDDKEVTIRTTGVVMGMDIPPQEQKIDLTKPFDPTKSTANLPKDANVKVEKLKEGTEKIKVADKEYDCKWESYKMKMTAEGMDIETEMKIWQAKELSIPIIKMEMTAEVAGQKMDVLMEMTETGSKAVKAKDEKDKE